MPRCRPRFGRAALDRLHAAVRVAAVMLERAHRRDHDDRVRTDPADAADDVEELLHPHVRAEAALRDDELAELQPHAGRDERAVAVRDVRERAAVDERRLTLERLHEVRLERVLQEHGHRARGADLLRGHGLVLGRVADRDRPEALAQVGQVARHGHDRHDFRGRSDVEAGLALDPVLRAAEPDDHLAEHPVVDVHAAAPGDALGVEAEAVPVHEVCVHERREQVVGRADRVDVAGEVEVQLLHRDDLRVAAPGRAALDAEHGADRRFAQAEDGLPPDRPESLGERDGGRRLALAGGGRRDRGDADELPVRAVGEPVEDGERDLGLRVAERLELARLDPRAVRDLVDRAEHRGLRDLEAGGHRRRHPAGS